MKKLGNKDLGTVKNNNKNKILWRGCWLCFTALARLMAFRVKHKDWSFVAEWWQTSGSTWLSHSIQTLYRYYHCCFCEGIFRMGTITYTYMRGLRVKQMSLTADRASFVQWHLKKKKSRRGTSASRRTLNLICSLSSSPALQPALQIRYSWAPQASEPMHTQKITPLSQVGGELISHAALRVRAQGNSTE